MCCWSYIIPSGCFRRESALASISKVAWRYVLLLQVLPSFNMPCRDDSTVSYSSLTSRLEVSIYHATDWHRAVATSATAGSAKWKRSSRTTGGCATTECQFRLQASTPSRPSALPPKAARGSRYRYLLRDRSHFHVNKTACLLSLPGLPCASGSTPYPVDLTEHKPSCLPTETPSAIIVIISIMMAFCGKKKEEITGASDDYREPFSESSSPLRKSLCVLHV